MAATSLTNTNSTKILELEDELATQLRDAVASREEIEVASFSEDEVLALGAVCARICALAGSRDICAWMEEDEGGKQSSAWEIISALVERSRLGYKEEERVSVAISALTRANAAASIVRWLSKACIYWGCISSGRLVACPTLRTRRRTATSSDKRCASSVIH